MQQLFDILYLLWSTTTVWLGRFSTSHFKSLKSSELFHLPELKLCSHEIEPPHFLRHYNHLSPFCFCKYCYSGYLIDSYSICLFVTDISLSLTFSFRYMTRSGIAGSYGSTTEIFFSKKMTFYFTYIYIWHGRTITSCVFIYNITSLPQELAYQQHSELIYQGEAIFVYFTWNCFLTKLPIVTPSVVTLV